MFTRINRELVPIKAHYFLYNAATGPVVPFLPTIAKQLGFSGFLVGTIYMVLPISGLIAKPLFGCLADKFRLHKTFFLLFQAILALAFFTINFIPEIRPHPEVTFMCNHGASFVKICHPDNFTNDVLHRVITSNKTVSTVHLSCESSQKAYKEMCEKWGAHQFCAMGEPLVGDKFEFDAQFNMFQDLVTYNTEVCVSIRVLNVTFDDKLPLVPNCDLERIKCMASSPTEPTVELLLGEVAHSKIGNSKSMSQTSTYQFHVFLWAAIISWVGMAVVVSIGDALCFNLLGDKSRDYGKQKMWGSVGFGIFGIGGGYLVDIFSKGETDKDYTCIFYIVLITMILDMLVSTKLKQKQMEATVNEPTILWEMWSVAREGRVLVFVWWCIGAGMCTGVIWNFLFLYTEEISTQSQHTWLKTLQGLLTGVQCFLGELPFNFMSGNILRKLGHVNVMSLVLLVYAVRFMAYSLFSNPWIFLVLEVLHGPSLGLCWPTMVSYGDKVAPTGTKATMQGLVGAVFEGIGVSSGSFLCGYLMDEYTGIVTFRVFSVGALVWLAVFWLLQLLLRKAKAYPLHQGHNHLASYAPPDDAILMTTSQEMQTY